MAGLGQREVRASLFLFSPTLTPSRTSHDAAGARATGFAAIATNYGERTVLGHTLI